MNMRIHSAINLYLEDLKNGKTTFLATVFYNTNNTSDNPDKD